MDIYIVLIVVFFCFAYLNPLVIVILFLFSSIFALLTLFETLKCVSFLLYSMFCKVLQHDDKIDIKDIKSISEMMLFWAFCTVFSSFIAYTALP